VIEQQRVTEKTSDYDEGASGSGLVLCDFFFCKVSVKRVNYRFELYNN